MEFKQIKELMAAMGRTGTKRITLKKDNFEITIERAEQGGVTRFVDTQFEFDETSKQAAPWSRTDEALSRGSDMPTGRMASQLAPESPKEDVNSLFVTSPMVGTFYTAPSPEDQPFIKVGDRVDKNSVVCIIEAMKVMNEVKANISGVVAEILVESGTPVEFGSKLLRINVE